MLNSEIYFQPKTLLITPNQRLARTLIKDSCTNKLGKHAQVTQAPNIKSLSDFTNALYNIAEECLYFDEIKYTLDDWQREVIFKNLIKQYNLRADATDLPTSIYKKIIQAWNITMEWQLDWQSWQHYPQIETKIFHELVTEYNEYLVTRNFLDPNTKIDRFLSLSSLQLIKLVNCSQIDVYGFDDLSPRMLKLFSRLRECGIEVNVISDEQHCLSTDSRSIAVSVAQNQEQEYYNVALWAKQQLQCKVASIGIIVPNLATHRKKLIKVFEEIIPDRQMWNISGGEGIDKIPVIKCAIILLELVINSTITLADAAYLLKSHYYLKTSHVGHTNPSYGIDLLISELYCNGYTEISVKELLAKLSDLDLLLPNAVIECAEELFKRLPYIKHRNVWENENRAEHQLLPSQWAKLFSQCLNRLGWPAGVREDSDQNSNNINSTEYQAITHLQSYLLQLNNLDKILGSTSATVVLSELKSILTNSVFQIQTDKNTIDILGMLEGAGIQYDKLWLFNLTSDVWPSSADPNPFIPIEIQREYQLPHATAEREFTYAYKLTSRYLNSAQQVIISFSKYEKDKENSLSLLVPDAITNQHYVDDIKRLLNEQSHHAPNIQKPELTAHNLDADSVFPNDLAPYKLINIIDEQAPVLEKSHIKSGLKALSLQAVCPFRAFAEVRLQAVKKFKLTIGPAAWLRGQIVHQILEYLFKEFNTKAKLYDFCHNDNYSSNLHLFILSSINKFKVSYKNIFTKGIIAIETEYLFKLIDNWLQVELTRDDFTVWALEQKFLLKLDNLEFNVRVDRIDHVRVSNSNEVKVMIIDYKTSKQNINNLFSDNISDLQLPLYTFIDKLEKVDAVLFGEILEDDCGFNGIANYKANIEGSVAVENWPDLSANWQREISNIAADFKSGNAKVAPISSTVCQNCHLPALCRKDEIC